jgi:RNA-binding protein YlmH
VQIEPIGLDEIKAGEQTLTTLRITVASLRLDKIVASGFGLSRTDAADIIRSGQVQLNWVVELRPDADVPIGATISLRGRGRIRLASEVGLSRKDRHILILEQYL